MRPLLHTIPVVSMIALLCACGSEPARSFGDEFRPPLLDPLKQGSILHDRDSVGGSRRIVRVGDVFTVEIKKEFLETHLRDMRVRSSNEAVIEFRDRGQGQIEGSARAAGFAALMLEDRKTSTLVDYLNYEAVGQGGIVPRIEFGKRNPGEMALLKGECIPLAVRFYDSAGTEVDNPQPLTWNTSTPTILEIKRENTPARADICGLAAGEGVIEVADARGSAIADATIAVVDEGGVAAIKITSVNGGDLAVKSQRTIRVAGAAYTADTKGKEIFGVKFTWNTDRPEVASIRDPANESMTTREAVVLGVKAGTVNIIAAAGNIRGQAALTVTE